MATMLDATVPPSVPATEISGLIAVVRSHSDANPIQPWLECKKQT